MNDYQAPLRDMQFVLRELAGLEQVLKLPSYREIDGDTVDAVLEEAAKFAASVLSPLNRIGDKQGSKWDNGSVKTPQGFKAAYNQYIEGGWNGFATEPQYGGQGLPSLVSAAVQEMWKASNMAFSLCPLLTQGAIEAIILCGSEKQKQTYLPNMVAGKWTGTMNLTEPQAGSDLSAVRTKAIPEGDHYRIFGQKIFITYGEHDLTENIIHMVLARTPNAPEGVKGISLFIVPKILVNSDGTLGARNQVHCVSIEHKLGIHASPTAVLAYGDKEGAIGYLVGEENRGLEYMFIMMNAARFAIGLEGIAISERAYQQALSYAKERVQSKDIAERGGKAVTIIHHADVRRMLMMMKAQIEAMRALAYVVAAASDAAKHHPDTKERAKNQAFVDLMIPVVKGWCTENAIEVTSLGIQVHGGMGYIEETGAAQHFRDARITAIYEGTTGIQANDLIGRKILKDQGLAVRALIQMMQEVANQLAMQQDENFKAIHHGLQLGIPALSEAVDFVLSTFAKDVKAIFAGSVPLLNLMGIVCGGWQIARAALICQEQVKKGVGDRAFHQSKIVTARVYADYYLSQVTGLKHAIIHGAPGILALAEESF